MYTVRVEASRLPLGHFELFHPTVCILASFTTLQCWSHSKKAKEGDTLRRGLVCRNSIQKLDGETGAEGQLKSVYLSIRKLNKV